jgi:2'-5' RNA ligase
MFSSNFGYYMKRLFAAIKIQPSDEFSRIYFNLRKELSNERINWVNPENIHITLKFFGETHKDRIPAINKALTAASLQFEPFSMKIEKTGIFGSSYKPKVIWFGIDDGGAISNLAGEVLTQLEKAGWERDRQNFVPHLTIARIKFLQNRDRFQIAINRFRESFIQEDEVTCFHLFESILHSDGPEYKKIETYDLD